MKTILNYIPLRTSLAVIFCIYMTACAQQEFQSLFDGKTFNGWEGDTVNTWRIEDGSIKAGYLDQKAPRNDFLCTTTSYDDFVLKFKFKLEGTEGFVNAGVQFRSQRTTEPSHEMIGYQADIGPGYHGSLYDESRRNIILAGLDSLSSSEIVNRGEWNDYEVIANKNRIQLKINGKQTVDYTEEDPNIPQEGIIGLQIHGNGKTIISYKDIMISEL